MSMTASTKRAAPSRLAWILGALCVALAASADRAAAQEPEADRAQAATNANAPANPKAPANAEASPSAEGPAKAIVGAGTTAGTTTGSSQAMAENGQDKEPPPPQAKLCDAYQGEVRRHCLETVLRDPQAGGNRASAFSQPDGEPDGEPGGRLLRW
ncbi:MAG TPA: hypothetical protein VFV10_01025 [Gammaproteobacteria bacterium]|nr:hypothetical protein [Gammaproteobacteria bacterium]